MERSIADATIECVNQPILLRDTEKTCINRTNTETQRASIQCNFSRLMMTSESDQYALIHHEYAGLAGFEKTGADGSNYVISNQIAGFLENQIIKRLAVKPGSDPQAYHVARDNYGRVLTMDQSSAVHYCERRSLHLPSFQEIMNAWTADKVGDSGLNSSDVDAIHSLLGRAFAWTSSLTSDPTYGVLYSKQPDENGIATIFASSSTMHAVICFEDRPAH
ncbi:MAG: hypothetical protein EOP06_31180 [Proteobacteria bacterium]|nr:MAG: hypothetical protein EOP06_31180 [Pseudomonadota bacterium]